MVKHSIEDYSQRAIGEQNPEVLLELAWQHFREQKAPKDIRAAIALLRQLEETSPERARFNIAKMKYLVGDETFQDEIQIDCNAKFGPALYLMGLYWNKKKEQGGLSKAICYFRAASQSGHLPSKILLWRASDLSVWRRLVTIMPVYLTGLRFIVIAVRDNNDVRVWT